jgi:hypothetical protein
MLPAVGPIVGMVEACRTTLGTMRFIHQVETTASRLSLESPIARRGPSPALPCAANAAASHSTAFTSSTWT